MAITLDKLLERIHPDAMAVYVIKPQDGEKPNVGTINDLCLLHKASHVLDRDKLLKAMCNATRELDSTLRFFASNTDDEKAIHDVAQSVGGVLQVSMLLPFILGEEYAADFQEMVTAAFRSDMDDLKKILDNQ